MPTDDIAEARKAIDTVLKHREGLYPNRAGTKRLAQACAKMLPMVPGALPETMPWPID